MSADDLSGRWTGMFAYPRGLPPTPFDATLREAGGRLSGTTVEQRYDGAATLHAVIDGVRTGAHVTFGKLYDDADGEHDQVAYDGQVDDSGLEIAGRWEIAGVWSGSFIMVRDGMAKVADAARVGETVDR